MKLSCTGRLCYVAVDLNNFFSWSATLIFGKCPPPPSEFDPLYMYLIRHFHIFKDDPTCVRCPLPHVPLLPADSNARALSLHDEPGESLSCRGAHLCSSCQHKVPELELSKTLCDIMDNLQYASTYCVDDHYHKLSIPPPLP